MKDYTKTYNKIEKEYIDKRSAEGIKENGKFNPKIKHTFEEDCIHDNVNEWSLCKEHDQNQEDFYEMDIYWEGSELGKCKKCVMKRVCRPCEEYFDNRVYEYARLARGLEEWGEPANFDKMTMEEIGEERKITNKGEVLLHSGKLINKYVDMHGPKTKTDYHISRTGSCYLTLKQRYEELKITVSDHFIVEASRKEDQFIKIEPGEVRYDGKKKEFFSEDNNQTFGGDLFDIVSHPFAEKAECVKILKLIKDFFK